jgi:electron transport complex protein RnfC
MAMSLYGGIWLELNKHPACDRPIESMPAPRTVYLPLRQHEGDPCVPTVKVGDAVKAGETIAAAGEGVSCPLQSPVSGTVREIAECSMPTGAASTMIVIDSDEREREYAHAGTEDTDSLTEENILDAAKDAGIASVSVFGPPLWARLEKMRDAEVDTLIINAVETEPYICSSQKIIDDYPDEVALGMSLMMRCVGADKGMLAVSDDIEPSVIDGMLESAHLAGPDLKLERIHQKYPSGFERYLIGLIKENRKIRDPLDVKAGFVYPEECMLLARMVTSGHPQTAKVITVSGDAVGNPQTMEVPLGTPVRDVLEHCGLIYRSRTRGARQPDARRGGDGCRHAGDQTGHGGAHARARQARQDQNDVHQLRPLRDRLPGEAAAELHRPCAPCSRIPKAAARCTLTSASNAAPVPISARAGCLLWSLSRT